MTLSEWDKTLAPHLRNIEEFSVSLKIRARWIEDEVNQIVQLPGWETKAEDALSKAKDQLAHALQTTSLALALLEKKRPLEAAE